MQGVPEKDIPALLVSTGEYVAKLQRELEVASRRVEALQAERARVQEERDQLQVAVGVLRQEKLSQAANLHAEIADVSAQLDVARAEASTHERQLRATEAALAQQRAAAESAASGSASQAASLAARVAELEARCAAQEEQLGELAALRGQVEQQGTELATQHAELQAAEQRHREEVAALVQERDECKEATRKAKTNAKRIVEEYKKIRATYRRRKEEIQQLQATVARLQGQGAGQGPAVAQPGEAAAEGRGAASGAAAAAGAVPERPPASMSARSDEEGSGSEQLFISEQQVSGTRRLPSINSGEVERGFVSGFGGSGTPTLTGSQPTQQQQQQRPHRLRLEQLPQQHKPQRSDAEVPEPRSPMSPAPPPAVADPPRVPAPPSAEAWPAEDVPPQAAAGVAVPPTDAGNLPASDGEEGSGDDTDATQPVPPPVAPVVCTQQPPVAQLHRQQQREQPEGLWRAQQEPAGQQQRQQVQPQGSSGHDAARTGTSSRQVKRPLQVEPVAIGAAGSSSSKQDMGPPLPRQPKRHQPSTDKPASGEPAQQGGQQRRRQVVQQQQQALQYDPLWSPLAGQGGAAQAAAAPPARAVVAASGAPDVQQPAALAGAPWPALDPSGPQQQQQQPQQKLAGGGWKSVVRTTAAHAAFDLGPDGRLPPLQQGNQAPRRGSGGQLAGPQGAGSAAFNGGGRHAGSGGGNGGSAAPSGGPGYKYQAVVRKKAEREKLQAVECKQCNRFYEALESWGTIGQETVRLSCGHVQQVGRDELRQEGSRHRYLYRPPDTQEGFWNMDLTQEPPAKKKKA